MPKRYQVVRLDIDGRWRFWAHGARFSAIEAQELKEWLGRIGLRTRLLLCGKDRT
jgi:hypothetical protein